MSENEQEAVVNLEIPRRPEYVGVARLAILGVASRMRFSYDEVEDIRLAVGEACTMAIERGGPESDGTIRISCGVGTTALRVDVVDAASSPSGGAMASALGNGEDELDEKALSGVLIRILMDEVDVETDAKTGQTAVRMVKQVAR